MAAKHVNRIIDAENVNSRPGKGVPLAGKSTLDATKPKRPVLCDIDKNVNLQQQKQNAVVPKKQCEKQEVLAKALIKPAAKQNLLDRRNSKKTITNDENSVKTATGVPKTIKQQTELPKSVAYSTARLEEKNDPLQFSEYVSDIYDYLRSLETQYAIHPNFLTSHRTTPRMRCILVDWMVDVHLNFSILSETLHLAVTIVDRYLQLNKSIGQETLQLVGLGALYVAGKYEEMYIPELEDFVYVADKAFSAEQILQMECSILKKLQFSLGAPSSLHFLRRFSKIRKAAAEHHMLGKYLLELALVFPELRHILPSLQAAAALCFSVAILNNYKSVCEGWSNELTEQTGYSYKDIRTVIILMADILMKVDTSKCQTVKTKYSASKFCKIALNPKLKGTMVKCLAIKAKMI